ncbi:4714_t:CDS:2 [Diversispora eburnea]|uniref:4714_t:CDS:1 n=1 Tax=Diversispora eburnea TaxID=1213867 RepID=A0A9N8UZK7_9GLOM|nr:4714_t:CDS:2 [Diversispora eburnea]
MSSEQNYLGYEALITYLTRSRNKSFWGFLRRCRDAIVATTSATSHWVDLDNLWAARFMHEATKFDATFDNKSIIGLARRTTGVHPKPFDFWHALITK